MAVRYTTMTVNKFTPDSVFDTFRHCHYITPLSFGYFSLKEHHLDTHMLLTILNFIVYPYFEITQGLQRGDQDWNCSTEAIFCC